MRCERGIGWLAPDREGMGMLRELGPSAPNWLGVVRLDTGGRVLLKG